MTALPAIIWISALLGLIGAVVAIWRAGEAPVEAAPNFPCNTCDTEAACKSAGWCREAD